MKVSVMAIGLAARALDAGAKGVQELCVKAMPTPVDVGTGGQMAMGPSPDGSKAKAIVMFTEGKVEPAERSGATGLRSRSRAEAECGHQERTACVIGRSGLR